MGLLETLLGAQNPLAQWAGQNQNYLGALGGGLGQGQNIQSGLAAGLAQVPQAKALDYQANEKRKADDKVVAQTNAGIVSLKAKYPDLAAAVEGGSLPVSEAWNEAFKRMAEDRKGGGLGGPYEGTGMDAQNWNILLAGDPSTPEYAAAFAQISAPKVTYKETVDGIVPVYESPTIPDSIRRPAGMAGAPAPAGAPTEDPIAAPGGISTGSALPGTVAKPTDAQRRAGQLYSVVAPDAELLLGSANQPGMFDALGGLGDQVLGGLNINGAQPLKWLSSSDYQRATNAITNIAQSYLYAISGQAAPAEEVVKIVQSVTPRPGEDAKAVADKKARLQHYVDAIRMGQNGAPVGGSGATGAYTVLGVEP